MNIHYSVPTTSLFGTAYDCYELIKQLPWENAYENSNYNLLRKSKYIQKSPWFRITITDKTDLGKG